MASSLFPHRTPGYKPFLAWFCGLALVWTICLLYAGGFTTSIQAGMAFLDWPLSKGSVNPEGWLVDRDMRAEHSHRLLGALVGKMTLIIFLLLLLREERPWLRRLGRIALLLVILQGVLGGARVRFDELNLLTDHNTIAQTFAIAHACLAQIFLCLLATITLCASRPWIERKAGLRGPMDFGARVLGVSACAALFLQLLAGAIMRHNQAGLAIPTFPWSTPTGGILPLSWSFPITIHFVHRAGAVVVTLLLLAFVWRLWRAANAGRGIAAGGGAVVALLGFQIFLGALTVLTLKNEFAATLHMLFGAFLLGLTWLLTLVCFRLPLQHEPQTEAHVSTEKLGHVRQVRA